MWQHARCDIKDVYWYYIRILLWAVKNSLKNLLGYCYISIYFFLYSDWWFCLIVSKLEYFEEIVISSAHYIGCPTHYRTRHFFNNFTTNEDIATKFEADVPHYVRNVKEKNVFLFKFRCNIFIGVRIIKEMSGSVASGTPCSNLRQCVQFKPSHSTRMDRFDFRKSVHHHTIQIN